MKFEKITITKEIKCCCLDKDAFGEYLHCEHCEPKPLCPCPKCKDIFKK